jgi:L-fuconolactonase
MVIEWSEHLFSFWRDWYPFSPQAPYLPETGSLSRYPVQEYLRSLDERQIDQAIIIQPEPYGDDHRLILYTLALEQIKLKAACSFLPSDPQRVWKKGAKVAPSPYWERVGVRAVILNQCKLDNSCKITHLHE